MPYFEQQVIESRCYDVLYIVEAKDVEEAKEKVALGETLAETEIKMREVIVRDPWDEPKECEKPAEEKPQDIVTLAKGLLEPGEEALNPEYTRALIELCCEVEGLSMERKPEMAARFGIKDADIKKILDV